jgi:TonB family protein
MDINTALLYRRRQVWTFWIAFACAAAIHVGAVVLAKGKSQKATTEDFKPPGVDLEVVDADPEPAPSEESITSPPPVAMPSEEEAFPEENRTPAPVRPRKKIRIASFTRGTAPPFGSMKAMVLYAPRPVYPYEARRQRITGSGIAQLTVDPASGSVTGVRMAQSCGNVILDDATRDAFRRWRLKPGTPPTVQVPITFTLMGASY